MGYDYWSVNSCSDLGSSGWFIRSSSTTKQCVHGDGLVWQYSLTVDNTMAAECSIECANNPPAAPCGSTSDLDGSTKTAGTIVTYSCSSLWRCVHHNNHSNNAGASYNNNYGG